MTPVKSPVVLGWGLEDFLLPLPNLFKGADEMVFSIAYQPTHKQNESSKQ